MWCAFARQRKTVLNCSTNVNIFHWNLSYLPRIHVCLCCRQDRWYTSGVDTAGQRKWLGDDQPMSTDAVYWNNLDDAAPLQQNTERHLVYEYSGRCPMFLETLNPVTSFDLLYLQISYTNIASSVLKVLTMGMYNRTVRRMFIGRQPDKERENMYTDRINFKIKGTYLWAIFEAVKGDYLLNYKDHAGLRQYNKHQLTVPLTTITVFFRILK